MTTPPTPAPAPEPAPPITPAPGGPFTHLEQWVAHHLAPEIADVRIKAENAVTYLKAHAAQEEAIASLLVKIVSAADPAAAPVLAALLPEAEAVLAKAEQRVADLAGTGM